MRDINRIDRITEKLNKIWKQSPDLRLGQLISNLAYEYCGDVFYIEDEVIEQRLNKQLKLDDEKENKNMKQFTKSDLKVGYLVRLADGTLCRLEQLKNGYIGLVTKDNSWILTLYKEKSDNYDENLKDKSDNSYDINEVYGYSDSGYNLYEIKNRELLWKREDMNFKKYEIECADNEKLSIEANYNEGYKANKDYKICLTITSDCNDELSVSLSISNAKELIESLQEIIDYVEGK